MPFSLAGKTAIVTGGASGIGLKIAEVFVTAGADVHILDLEPAAIDAAVQRCQRMGSKQCSGHVCDVTDARAVNACFDRVCSAGRRCDCLVNNAGIGAVGTVEQATAAEMDRLYAVNVKGVFHCLQAGVKKMLADGKGGAIVNLASIASLIGLADRFSYSMTKGAVLTMTYSVATDYCKRGIRCNCVCPGRVHTPFVDGYLKKNYPGKEAEMFKKLSEYQPVGRMGQPEEIAHCILYLCSDEASFCTGSAGPLSLLQTSRRVAAPSGPCVRAQARPTPSTAACSAGCDFLVSLM